MRRGILVATALVLGLVLVLSAGLYAQVKKDDKTGMDRLSGRIQSIDKAKSTITLRGGSNPNPIWKVIYTEKTAITLRNAPAKVDDLKDGTRVIVLGKYEKDVMNAVRIDVREEK